MKKLKMKSLEEHRGLRAVLTIELSYLFALLFFIFIVVIHTIFYYHDKNILLGTACETAVLWAQLERREDEVISSTPEEFYQGRVSGKLILFPEASVRVTRSEEIIEVAASAQKGMMKVKVHGTAEIMNTEEKIRKKRIIDNWIEEEPLYEN
ncbi:MAG: pilus assembly protein [Schaedlerella sp.]|nr:pilus assembly protein [Schaedlerella sp.]